MAGPASIIPIAGSDGITYCTNVPLTSNEADLGDSLKTTDPIAIQFGQLIVAVVVLSINGYVVGQNSYVVMQTDMGDGVWVDVAWLVWTGNQSTATFVLFGGGPGNGAGSFQQTRPAGTFPSPQSLGSNALPLAGRMRFVGKSQFVGGSSSIAGQTTSVSATIKFKLLAPR